mgnify:CR=1 FL=1
MTNRFLTKTVWKFRDVCAALLMLDDRVLMQRLVNIGERDLDLLRDATNTIINVFFGQQKGGYH